MYRVYLLIWFRSDHYEKGFVGLITSTKIRALIMNSVGVDDKNTENYITHW
jgi:hypothetical protein